MKSATQEFDYPRGDANVFGTYDGKGGVDVGGVFRRLLFAVRFRSPDTFFSPNLTDESRVLMSPAHCRAREPHRAVPDVRPGSLSCDLRRAAGMDTGRVHHQPALSVFDAERGRHQLHPQLGEGDHRCLRRHDRAFTSSIPRIRSRPPSRACSRGCSSRCRRCRRICARALRYPQGIFALQAVDVRHVPHDESVDVLQPRGSVGRAVAGAGRGAGAADGRPTTRS